MIRHCDFLEGFSIADTFEAIFQAWKCNKSSTANLVSDSIKKIGLEGNPKVAGGKKNNINGGVAFHLTCIA